MYGRLRAVARPSTRVIVTSTYRLRAGTGHARGSIPSMRRCWLEDKIEVILGYEKAEARVEHRAVLS